jgi:Arc/MetJ-type ribon-helix-helix transcriptional regulator
MCVKTKEFTIEVPEYLYEESLKLTRLGLFRDLSDLVAAGLRRELQEAKELVGFEPEDWKEEGLAKLRAQVRERRAKYGYEDPSEGEILAELRAARREIWEKEILSPDSLEKLLLRSGLRLGDEVIVRIKAQGLEIATNPARVLWGSLHSSKDASQLKLEAYAEMGDLLDAKLSG